MGLDPREFGRMRLVSQGLVEPFGDAAEVVRQFGCTQGQDFPGSMRSIALRTKQRSLDGVREAYDQGKIVRSWPMRGTLFVLAAEDLHWMLEVTGAKMFQATARRRQQLALTPMHLKDAASIARRTLTTARTRAHLLEVFEDAGIGTFEGRGYHLLFALSLQGVICQGPTDISTGGKEHLWVNCENWITERRAFPGDEGIYELLRRYVLTHGPVPLSDFLWWTKLAKRDISGPALALSKEMLIEEIDGVDYWMAPDLPDRYADLKRATASTMLLPGFDEMVLGYGDRTPVLSREEERLVVPGSNGVFKPTVFHLGRAVATWKKPTKKKDPVTATAFANKLPAAVEKALPRLTKTLPQ